MQATAIYGIGTPQGSDYRFMTTAETNQMLYLDRGSLPPVDVVYVQHKRFSVMCVAEGEGRLRPLACPLDAQPNALLAAINNKEAHVRGTALHQSDRDLSSYRLHTWLSNQLANW